jgi:hypothetical protein
MRTVETDYPHFWMLEDAQLRFEATARKADLALKAASDARKDVPENLLPEFDKGVTELKGFKQRCLAYTYHIRESNICLILRQSIEKTGKADEKLVTELKQLLEKDRINQGRGNLLSPAIDLLNKDIRKFLAVYFIKPDLTNAKVDMYFNDSIPANVKTVWTITSK